MSSKEKILKNIKKNILKKVPLKNIELTPITFEKPLEEFIKNFLASGGKLTKTPTDIMIEGVFGVAENGAVLLKEVEDRKDYTYHESITIKLNQNSILNNMHEAYKNLKIKNFALFMAGPSKTADIEQSLVIGAHGAKRCFLYLYKES